MLDVIRADPTLALSLSRVALILGGLAGLAALWRRPRPAVATGIVIALHLAAWASFVAPLGRLYGLGEHLDRSFNVGMAACAAAGNSPFEHVQVRHSSAEPFWNGLVAALAFFRPERVMSVYYWLSPLSIVAVSLGLYVGLRQVGADDAWERALIVSSVLGLSSFSASQQSPLPPFWTGNFLLKPNHVTALALGAVIVGMAARRTAPWRLGLALGLLSWIFVLTWGYLLPGLILAALLVWRRDPSPSGEARPATSSAWRSLLIMLTISVVIAAPYVLFLMRDYSPAAKEGSAGQMWRDPLARVLAQPHWATLDLGLLLVLGSAGIWAWLRRGSARDRVLLCIIATVAVGWLAYEVGAPFGIAPEPDEFHYFLRFVLALAAGTALAALGRVLEARGRFGPGQGHLLVLAGSLPLSFIAYWDPSTMDRYYRWSRPPLNPLVVQYGDWVRASTPKDAVFLAGRSASIWIPALAGRRVLLTGDSRPPRDYGRRARAERQVMRSRDPDRVMAALHEFRIGYVAVDAASRDEHGDVGTRLSMVSGLKQVFVNPAVEIFEVLPQPRTALSGNTVTPE